MMARLLVLGMVSSVSATKLFMYNSTDTYGFGYKANAAEIDYANGAFSAAQSLPNQFDSTMVSISGAAACGKHYIAIQTNAPLGAGLAVAGLGENGTTLQYNTDLLFHAVACSPTDSAEVYAVVNNPFSANATEHTTFRAITYNFLTQTVVKELGAHTLSSKDPLFQDSGFAFSGDRSQMWMINDKSIIAFDLSSGASAVHKDGSLNNWYPYQIEGDSIQAGGATGFASQTNSDGLVTEFAYGAFELSGGKVSFKKSSKVGDLTQVWNRGLPWAFCTQQKLAFVVNIPTSGSAAATLSVFSLPELGVVAEKALPLASGQNRIVAALAAEC